MSRLTELIARAKAHNAQLGADLEREFKALASRRAFGLNFERHQPEAVELPNRQLRKGDKVRILPARGTVERGDQRLWQVAAFSGQGADRVANLRLLQGSGSDEIEMRVEAVSDLIVVAGFKDFIYPGLESTGRIEQGGDKPFHTVIAAENFHALQALTFTHRGKVDAIYIDPPYNSGATDWKYNNDYVGKEDVYRHSKWLAFMERRLRMARELLKSDNSVLIVAIDDKEGNRLGVLLDQMFPEARIEMITSVINPRGKYRDGEFARCEDYIFFVAFGAARVLGEPDEDYLEGASVAWRTLRRSDLSSARGTKKGGTGQFYPIYVDNAGKIAEIGEAMPHSVPRDEAPARAGCTPVFPVRDDGTEMNWGLTAPSLRELLSQGYVRVGKATPSKPQAYELSYLTSGRIEDISTGRATVIGHSADGSVLTRYATHKLKLPISSWHRASHNAEIHGTDFLKSMIGERGFPYPKSLYAVEDCLRFFVSDKPEAVIVDFFAGSGTTAHAVMRLNRQDGGRRQSICVSNNEVSATEQAALRKAGLRPGDNDWEKWGICDHITKPRIRSAITGKTPGGVAIEGAYQFADIFAVAEGFAENAEFFSLTYEAPLAVDHNRAFDRIGPLLWLRAGAEGRRIETLPDEGWAVVDRYGLLVDLDQTSAFVASCKARESLQIAFVVTNDERRFEAVARALPHGLEVVRLYEAYLTNFRFANGGEA